MTPAEHYFEAEALLKQAEEYYEESFFNDYRGGIHDVAPQVLRALTSLAHVHAQLATAYMPSASQIQDKTFGTSEWGKQDAWGGKKPEDIDPHRP